MGNISKEELEEQIDSGVSADELTPIRTQVELLSKYWAYRVIKSDSSGDAATTENVGSLLCTFRLPKKRVCCICYHKTRKVLNRVFSKESANGGMST